MLRERWILSLVAAFAVHALACTPEPNTSTGDSTAAGTSGAPASPAGAGTPSAPEPPPAAAGSVAGEAGQPAAGSPVQTAGAPAAGGGAAAPSAGSSAGAPAQGGNAASAPVSGAPAAAGSGGHAGAAPGDAFVLIPIDFPMYGNELTFPEAANPPTNASPAFEWKGVPAGAKSLALVFRDLGNDAVKWVLWDIPPTLTRIPANIAKTAMPAEVQGASQLGSLNNQGYAGPGSGARQYDFTLWALDVDKLPVTSRMTTVQIHDDVLPMHDIAKTTPVLVRNTRNL